MKSVSVGSRPKTSGIVANLASLNDKAEVLLRALVIVGTLVFLATASEFIRRPYQVDYSEGVILATAVHTANGGSPYADPRPLPSLVSPYGPLFYDVAAGVIRYLGVNFWGPRLLVLLFTIGCALFLASLLHHWTANWAVALTFGLLFLNLPLVQLWALRIRADIPGLCFALCGLYLFVKLPRGYYIAVPAFVAAALFKISFVAAPAACLIYLITQETRRREAVAFALTYSAAMLMVFSWYQHQTHGWFILHIFRSHPDPFSIAQLGTIWMLILAWTAGPICLALLFLFSDQPGTALIKFYLLLAAASVFASGKVGSESNYGLEAMAAVCIAAGLEYKASKSRPNWSTAVLVLLCVTAGIVVSAGVTRLNPATPRNPATAGCPQLYEYVRNYPGDTVLAENVGAVVMSGKRVWVADPFMFWNLTNAGKLSSSTLEEMIANKKFDLIVLGLDMDSYAQLRSYRWPPKVLSLVRTNYYAAQRFNCLDATVAFEPVRAPAAQRSAVLIPLLR